MDTKEQQSLTARRPRDRPAAQRLDRLMANAGLSCGVLGAQVGVSGRRIQQIVHEHDVPGRHLKYLIARRFDLLPADIWKSEAKDLTPVELDHMRALARRSEGLVAA